MSYIVALTGGIGSGKTTVSNAFAQLGVPIVDADVIARQVVELGQPALSAIAKQFGHQVLNSDGSLNRRVLREAIFNDPINKQWLNNLLHPLIAKETHRQFAVITAPYILWVVPLLIENGLTSQANRILVVDVEPELQLQRTMDRDGVSRELAEQILSAQVSRQTRLTYADDVINNSVDVNTIPSIVEQLHKHYLQLAAQYRSS